MIAALDDAGYRLTGRRREVAELIAAREGHFTAADLILDARSRRLAIGRATIFRALDLLTELKLLERLDLPEGEHAYVTCEPSHHHHVVCSSCGRVREVEDHGSHRRRSRRSSDTPATPSTVIGWSSTGTVRAAARAATDLARRHPAAAAVPPWRSIQMPDAGTIDETRSQRSSAVRTLGAVSLADLQPGDRPRRWSARRSRPHHRRQLPWRRRHCPVPHRTRSRS